jgi:hypothetical protein
MLIHIRILSKVIPGVHKLENEANYCTYMVVLGTSELFKNGRNTNYISNLVEYFFYSKR